MQPGVIPVRNPNLPSSPVVEPAVQLDLRTRLPEPPSTLIDRERDTADLYSLLQRSDARLVTLTGPGGIGKTRLALNVAKSISLDTTTTVVFVPLVSIADPSHVGSAIAAAFGIAEGDDQSLAERLAALLRDTPFLLVLDNFEHLIDAAPITFLLLGECQGLKILCTSRRPLRVTSEVEYPVAPLEISDPDDDRSSQSPSASFRLFVDRANRRMIDPAANAGTIEAICRKLDGLPLAIELAAARTRVLSPEGLLGRLEHQLPLLSGGPRDAPARLRNMREAISWSYDLLTESEQRLFRLLSVFRGGFTLEAVEAVAPCDAEADTFDAFSSLIEHHLVRRRGDDEPPRFMMLETIREFAGEQLSAHGEEEAARDRHAAWLVEQIGNQTAAERLHSYRMILPILPGEHNNLRAALAWCIASENAPQSAQLAYGLISFWATNGLLREALDWLQRTLDLEGMIEPSLRAEMLCSLTSFAFMACEYPLAFDAASEAMVISRQLGDPAVISRSLHCLGLSTIDTDPARATDRFTEAIAVSQSIGDNFSVVHALTMRSQALISCNEPGRAKADALEVLALNEHLDSADTVRALALPYAGWSSGMLGEFDAASGQAEQALALGRKLGFSAIVRPSLRTLGEVAMHHGDLSHATSCFQEALQLAYREGVGLVTTALFIEIGMLAQAAGDWTRAARLFGAAEAAWTRYGFARSTMAYATWRYDVETARDALGESMFANAFAAGGSLTTAEAFAEAMDFTVQPPPADAEASTLTRRETQVLRLVALGQTNSEIAAALFVSTSTIDSHVSSILAKLDARSRLAAVNAARERGLIDR